MGIRDYVIIEESSYPVDTEAQIEKAIAALREAGLTEASIWHGDPDDPDSYESTTRKLFA